MKAQTYSFEAANVRHEHEWRVWQNAKLPPGKMLMPGVVSHATSLVEHPQLVADRILRYAAIVGRENVIAGTDCGLGGRVHADLAWAKLRTLADALREEYRAVVAAGLILQIDDPGLPDWWDMLKPEPSVEAYRQFARRRIDAVNHALAGIPEERVRYHLCWGSWHGPHTHDLPLKHIIDLILEVKAQTYSFEAANVRHEHEWRVWQNAKLPPGKMLMPGVVSHATNLVEHPQLVADRILRYAAIVGRENVVAGTDCGLGGRVHADLAWAKLRTLPEGARLASQSLRPG